MTSILLNMMDTSRNGSSDCVKPPPIARSSSIGSSTNNGLSLNADPAFRSANKTQSDHNAQHKESPVTVEPSLFPKGIHKVAVDGQHRHRSSPLWRPDSSEQQRSTTLSLYPPSNIGVYPWKILRANLNLPKGFASVLCLRHFFLPNVQYFQFCAWLLYVCSWTVLPSVDLLIKHETWQIPMSI